LPKYDEMVTHLGELSSNNAPNPGFPG